MKWNLSLGSMALILSSGWAQSSRKSLPHHLIMSNICLYCFTVAPLRHACNFYYRFLLHLGRQGMLKLISALFSRRRGIPRTRRQFIIGRQRQTTILTHTYGQFRVPSWPHVLECEDGSQSIWEKTAEIRKKLHTASSQAEESSTQPLLLWGNTANPELQQILS